MSPLIARLLLAIFIFPCAFLIYLVAYLYADEYVALNLSTRQSILLAGSVTWIFVAVYWTVLWRKSVRWTPPRQIFTFASIPAAAVIGLFVGTIVANLSQNPGLFLGVNSAIMTWLIATVWIWRETSAERGQRLLAGNRDGVVCPKCGYNMTGLREARCPECGAQFTIDELFAAQPSRAPVEVSN
jgi:hypothetical protein